MTKQSENRGQRNKASGNSRTMGTGRGWHGDSAGHAAAGRAGGEAVSRDREHMAAIGRKGGETVSQDRSHMAQIGREGGEAVSKDRRHMAEIGRQGGEARGQSNGSLNTSSGRQGSKKG